MLPCTLNLNFSAWKKAVWTIPRIGSTRSPFNAEAGVVKAAITAIAEQHLHLVRPIATGRLGVIDVRKIAGRAGEVWVEAELLLLLGGELRLRRRDLRFVDRCRSSRGCRLVSKTQSSKMPLSKKVGVDLVARHAGGIELT